MREKKIKYLHFLSICLCFSFLIFILVLYKINLNKEPIKTETTAININHNKMIDIEIMRSNQYLITPIVLCSSSSIKTYMSYKAITKKDSSQYKYIENNMIVNEKGLLIHKDYNEYIGIALGSYFGSIGSMYEIILDTGKTIKVVKVEAKGENHTINGCSQISDGSFIEFVIDVDRAKSYYGILQGNFNNFDEFNGNIIKINKITPVLEL